MPCASALIRVPAACSLGELMAIRIISASRSARCASSKLCVVATEFEDLHAQCVGSFKVRGGTPTHVCRLLVPIHHQMGVPLVAWLIPSRSTKCCFALDRPPL